MDQEMQRFLDSPDFRRIQPAKAEMIREMLGIMDTKEGYERIRVLIAYSFKMKNAGLSLSPEESQMMIRALESGMTPSEREKIEALLRML